MKKPISKWKIRVSLFFYFIYVAVFLVNAIYETASVSDVPVALIGFAVGNSIIFYFLMFIPIKIMLEYLKEQD